MTRKLVTMLLALLIALLPLCASAESAAVSVTDMMGRGITLDGPVDRVVALTASECEILCALGEGDLLVGRGEYCDYPESILDVPVVQSGAETNIEQILALAPDVVFMSKMAQTTDQVQALENAGIRVVMCDADDIAETFVAIRLVGAILGRDNEAEALIADMQATFDDIAARSENTGKTVYFEVSPLEWGLWTAGAKTFMDEIANLCGLTNIFSDVEDWVEVSEEQVLLRNPDYIFTITMYFGEGPLPTEEIMARPGWQGLSAVAEGNVFSIDSNEFSRPGPRLKDAALALFNLLNAE